jgi:hypothetical protein
VFILTDVPTTNRKYTRAEEHRQSVQQDRRMHTGSLTLTRSAAGTRADALLLPGIRAQQHLHTLLRYYDPEIVELARRQRYWQKEAATLLTLPSRYDTPRAQALRLLADRNMLVPFARTPGLRHPTRLGSRSSSGRNSSP